MKNLQKSIAVFDDDEDILSICTFFLESLHWNVFSFNNCTNIIEKVGSTNPSVILMDNWIPDTGGIIATQLLKKSEDYRKIPVIYFSANSAIEALASEAGADYFLAKPFHLDAMQAIVDKAIQSAG